MTIYIHRRDSSGRAAVSSCGCPLARDCYLCKYNGCRTFADGCVRIEGVTDAELPRIRQRANITHIIKEEQDNGSI